MTSLPVIPGRREGFVQPATYLRRPRGQSQPMAPAKPESAVERDQRVGLVSQVGPSYLGHVHAMPPLPKAKHCSRNRAADPSRDDM